MKMFQELLFLKLLSLLLVPSVFGIPAWCKNYFEGFALEDNYNPNYPPTDNFTLSDVHHLSQIEKVKYANLILLILLQTFSLEIRVNISF